jgi:hypothetical protein
MAVTLFHSHSWWAPPQMPTMVATTVFPQNYAGQPRCVSTSNPAEMLDYPLSLEISGMDTHTFDKIYYVLGLPAVYFYAIGDYRLANDGARWSYELNGRQTFLRFKNEEDMMLVKLAL